MQTIQKKNKKIKRFILHYNFVNNEPLDFGYTLVNHVNKVLQTNLKDLAASKQKITSSNFGLFSAYFIYIELHKANTIDPKTFDFTFNNQTYSCILKWPATKEDCLELRNKDIA